MLLRDRLIFLICAALSYILYVYLLSKNDANASLLLQVALKTLPGIVLYWLLGVVAPRISAWHLAGITLLLMVGMKALQYVQDPALLPFSNKIREIFCITSSFTTVEVVGMLSALFICVRLRKSIFDRN